MRRYAYHKIRLKDATTTLLSDGIALSRTAMKEFGNHVIGTKKILIAIKCDLCDDVEFENPDDIERISGKFHSFKTVIPYPHPMDGVDVHMDICYDCLIKHGGNNNDWKRT